MCKTDIPQSFSGSNKCFCKVLTGHTLVSILKNTKNDVTAIVLKRIGLLPLVDTQQRLCNRACADVSQVKDRTQYHNL